MNIIKCMYIVSATRAYNNAFSTVKKRNKPKNGYFIYQYDENYKFSRKRVSKIRFYWTKYFVKKWKNITFKCENCNQKFVSLVRNKKKSVRCPNCEM